MEKINESCYIKGMNANAMLMRRIDPNEPLLDAVEMLRAAHAVIAQSAPVVRAADTRMQRRFRRTPQQVANSNIVRLRRSGASRFYSRDMSRAFSVQSGRAFAARDTRMASRFLMAGPQQLSVAGFAPRIQKPVAPTIDLLEVLRNRSRAIMVAGMLTNRFNVNRADLADGKPDVSRTFLYQARYGRPGYDI